MASLSQILVNSVHQDQRVRDEANQQLQLAENSHYPNYLTTLCAELSSADRSPEVRQLAGIVLKNCLFSKDEQRQEHFIMRWLQLDDNIRNSVKQAVFETLQSPERTARTAACQVFATICSIEIGRNVWKEAVPFLMSRLEGASNDFKQSILTVLSILCEEGPPSLQDHSGSILNAIATGMRKEETDNGVRLTATYALLHALAFASSNFEQDGQRHHIMMMISEAIDSPDPKIQEIAFQCLVRIASLYYDKLPDHLDMIATKTIGAIKDCEDDDDNAMLSLEVWTTICEEEIEIREINEEDQQQQRAPSRPFYNIAAKYANFLVPLITNHCLMLQDPETQESDAHNVPNEAGNCLSNLALAAGDDVVPLVIPFVDQHINSENWKQREAAIVSFGCILEGPTKEKLVPLVRSAMTPLLQRMSDTVVIVKDSTAWTLGRICETMPELIGSEFLQPTIQVLLAGLRDAPAVASHCCWAIHNLALAVDTEEDGEDGEVRLPQTNSLSPYFQALLEALFAVTEREDAKKFYLRTSAYETLGVLANSAAKDMLQFVERLLTMMIERLQNSFNVTQAQDRNELQALICGCLQVLVQKVQHAVAPVADQMMVLLLRVFSTDSSSVHEEALMAVGSLAITLGSDFVRYLPHLQHTLVRGLKNHSSAEVCSASIGVLGDVCRAVEVQIAPMCDDLITVLLENLGEKALDKSVKPSIISVLGDIALAIGGRFDRYLQHVLHFVVTASETPPEAIPEEDRVEYINQLREGVLECYTGIVHGLHQDGKVNLLLPAAPKIAQLIETIANDPDAFPSVVRTAVALVGDIAKLMGKQTQSILISESVNKLVSQCLSDQEDEDAQETAQYAQQALAALRS